jgi:hypothetical protein
MLHVCVQRFDVTGNLKILAKFLSSKGCLNGKAGEPYPVNRWTHFKIQHGHGNRIDGQKKENTEGEARQTEKGRKQKKNYRNFFF